MKVSRGASQTIKSPYDQDRTCWGQTGHLAGRQLAEKVFRYFRSRHVLVRLEMSSLNFLTYEGHCLSLQSRLKNCLKTAWPIRRGVFPLTQNETVDGSEEQCDGGRRHT